MTIPAIGHPDWLSGTPGGSQPLISDSYSDPINAHIWPTQPVGAYRALAIYWNPDQNQVLSPLFVTNDANGGAIAGRDIVALAGTYNLLNLPVLGPAVELSVAGLAAFGTVSGILRVVGHGGSTDYGANRGTKLLVSVNSVSIAASGVLTTVASSTAEGPATFTAGCPGSPPNWNATLTALDPNNTTRFLSRMNGATGVPMVTVPVYLPPWPCTVTLTNADGAAAHIEYASLIVGG